jgi:hypothetical protein
MKFTLDLPAKKIVHFLLRLAQTPRGKLRHLARLNPIRDYDLGLVKVAAISLFFILLSLTHAFFISRSHSPPLDCKLVKVAIVL